MSKNKLILENSNSNWNADRRYKVNDIVSYGGYDYQNKTGANSDPNLSVDWIKIPYYGVIYPISIIASATAPPPFATSVGAFSLPYSKATAFLLRFLFMLLHQPLGRAQSMRDRLVA